MFTSEIKESLIKVLKDLKISFSEDEIILEHPADFKNGDYSTNFAIAKFVNLKSQISCRRQSLWRRTANLKAKTQNLKLNNPKEFANCIVKKWQEVGLPEFIEKVEVAGVGFINIWLKTRVLVDELKNVGVRQLADDAPAGYLRGKKIMVEFTHPNTHKELHIGHMRTLITGEALSRILTADGAEVFRANYQGDIGPHVAKAIWGTQKLLRERGLTWEQAEEMTFSEKAHLLGEGYVLGSKNYEISKDEIDALNGQLYNNDPGISPIYDRTRRWSLEYYQAFYARFGTKFDKLFFESEIAKEGKKVVEENTPRVFEKSEGAIIFDGEKYGLHKRVFITSDGNPTYEGKEMALAFAQFAAFPFDKNIHVVGNEQAGYFKVVMKALEVLEPKFVGKEFHLSMGMVSLVGKKMSSRTGEILKVDDLLDKVKDSILPLIKDENLPKEEKENIAEVLTIAAVKYSVLRVGPTNNVTFDIEKSVSLEGDSGPYIEYTYARTQSVLRKVVIPTKSGFAGCVEESLSPVTGKGSLDSRPPCFATRSGQGARDDVSDEETTLLRTLYRFPEVVLEAAKVYGPNVICSFLFNLSQKFNAFYDKHRILRSKIKDQRSNPNAKTQSEDEVTEEQSHFRLLLTAAAGQVLKNGLNLLGIEALSKM